MPVVFVEYGIGFGGAVVSLSELVSGLRESGLVDPTVISFQEPDVVEGLFDGAREVRLARPLNYRTRQAFRRRVDRVSPRLVGLAMKVYAACDLVAERILARQLHRVIRRSGAAIVHLNNGRERSGLMAARRAGVPVVMHARGFGDPGIPEMSAWERDVVARYVAISSAVAEDLEKSGAPADRIRTVLNPVSVERFDAAAKERESLRQTHGLSADEVVVAVYGRITGWKGQLEFLRAIERAAPECPDLVVMLVGDESDTSPEYIASVRELAGRLPLRRDVIFAGYQKDVEAYYAMADIVVHCSTSPEPFGRVVIEGMAARRPVIAMDEGGPRDIIEHGVDGLLVPPRDVDALANAILELYRSSDTRDRLSDAGRQAVDARFTATASANAIWCIYREVLGLEGERDGRG